MVLTTEKNPLREDSPMMESGYLRESTIHWLLEADNPPVRYLTLKGLLGKPEGDPEVSEARSRLGEYEVTQKILDQVEMFRDDENAYKKYTGAYWQVIFLGCFLADGSDSRLAPLLDELLRKKGWIDKRGGQCLTANMLSGFTRLGLGDDPTVVTERETLARRIVDGNGIVCSAVDHSPLPRCYMAQSKLFQCFSLIPKAQRSQTVVTALGILSENLLEHEVFVYVSKRQKEWQQIIESKPKKGELPKGHTIKEWVAQRREEFVQAGGLEERKPKAGWLKFGFPIHYNSDVLETMYSLALLDIAWDPRLKRAIDLIEGKMTPDGRWILESSLNGKMLADVEVKGKSSKWLTYFALYVLKHFGKQCQEVPPSK
jgi:hypothetical protein